MPSAPSRPAPTPAPRPAPQTQPAMPPGAGSASWLASQTPAHFTLQLGAFSESAFASKLVAEAALGAAAHIQRQPVDGQQRFLVLYGSYPTRAAAESAARPFRQHQPWIRRIGDLQAAVR